jgi:hypothetical protein
MLPICAAAGQATASGNEPSIVASPADSICPPGGLDDEPGIEPV